MTVHIIFVNIKLYLKIIKDLRIFFLTLFDYLKVRLSYELTMLDKNKDVLHIKASSGLNNKVNEINRNKQNASCLKSARGLVGGCGFVGGG